MSLSKPEHSSDMRYTTWISSGSLRELKNSDVESQKFTFNTALNNLSKGFHKVPLFCHW